MALKAPLKANCKGLALQQVTDLFGNKTPVTQWPNSLYFRNNGSFNVPKGIVRKYLLYRDLIVETDLDLRTQS